MPVHSGSSTIADTMKRNSLYILALGAAGALLGFWIIDSQALAFAGLLTIAIGAIIAVVSAVVSRRQRVTGE